MHTNMLISLVVTLLTVQWRLCTGCGPVRYVPQPGEVLEKESGCVDCSRVQTRFSIGSRCCSEITKVDDIKRTRRMTNTSHCGRKGGEIPYDPHTKIVGGVEAVENEFPWQVGILTAENTWQGCSAVLLSCDPVIVVSAAHCLNNTTPSDIKLAFGAHRMQLDAALPLDTNEVRLDVEEIIIHPLYRMLTFHIGNVSIGVRNNLKVELGENDIAVIKVKNGESLPCNRKTIWPACLPDKDFEYAGWKRSIVTGWGKVGDDEPAATVLRKARVPIVSDKQCIENMNLDNPDQPYLLSLAATQLCAGNIKNRVGMCHGDSGGPLVTRESDKPVGWAPFGGWAVVGIASHFPISSLFPDSGPQCGGGRYGVFTQLGKYLDWIAEKHDLLPPDNSDFCYYDVSTGLCPNRPDNGPCMSVACMNN